MKIDAAQFAKAREVYAEKKRKEIANRSIYKSYFTVEVISNREIDSDFADLEALDQIGQGGEAGVKRVTFVKTDVLTLAELREMAEDDDLAEDALCDLVDEDGNII